MTKTGTPRCAFRPTTLPWVYVSRDTHLSFGTSATGMTCVCTSMLIDA